MRDRTKKKKFDADYNDARELLRKINLKISENNHNLDDEVLLKQLTNTEVRAKRIGKIKNFNFQKGYGFIDSNGGSFFLHINSVLKDLQIFIKEGVNVSFISESTPKGLAAKDVIVEK